MTHNFYTLALFPHMYVICWIFIIWHSILRGVYLTAYWKYCSELGFEVIKTVPVQ